MPRSYHGRPLPRPDEEVVDQGLGFDLTTMTSRRRLLAILGIGSVGAGLAACGPSTTPTAGGSSAPAGAATSTSTGAPGSSSPSTGPLTEIPDETAGPFPADGSNGPDVLEQSGVVRSDIRSSFGGAAGTAAGVPITLDLTIRDLASGGVPFAGVAVYVWQCDRDGNYSLYSQAARDQNYLRGVQIADAAGKVSFTSIFPACYPGRWPHIHFEVYPNQTGITDAANAIATSQVALPKDVCDTVFATTGYQTSISTFADMSLTSDSVFGEDAGATQLATVTGDVSSGFQVALPVGVDTRTAPRAGGGRGGGPGRP